MAIKSFEEIEGWKLARELTQSVYTLTRGERFCKDFGLVDQIRRASGSVMHNIAEGFDSGSDAEFMRFLGYSQRSATEVKSHLFVALDQAYITEQEFVDAFHKATRVHAVVGGFIRYLKSKPKK
jgi:four helix bundle protein